MNTEVKVDNYTDRNGKLVVIMGFKHDDEHVIMVMTPDEAIELATKLKDHAGY